MTNNPYLSVWIRQWRNRRQFEGPWTQLRRMVVPLVSALLLVLLVRPIFLGFLDEGAEGWGYGLQQVALRGGIVVITALSLDIYSALIRGPDRAVLDIHPVNARQVVLFEMVRVAARRWWLVPLGAILLLPLAVEGAVGLWGLGVLVLACAWAMGLTSSAMMHLLAVQAAESKRIAPLLDMARGQNPRPQAAFLYAPGAVLLVCGGLVVLASQGANQVWSGESLGGIYLLLPLLVAAACASAVPRLAEAGWFRASPILADIDARYAAIGEREDGLRVYLDWTVRFLPQGIGRYAMKDFRHGWRGRRTLLVGAWLVGVAAFIGGWSDQSIGVERAALAIVAGIWLCSAVCVLMDKDEPEFLRAWLPAGGSSRYLARAYVLCAWLQPCLWLGVASVTIRRGLIDGGAVLLFGVVAMVLAVPSSMVCGQLRDRGLAVYGPVAAVAAAVLGVLITGGWS
ncbi:MAG: hypothetical protein HN348_08900 [Proteobacteria bacterium]|nr:hypothetical protein [Pseudomonadota bacterium]